MRVFVAALVAAVACQASGEQRRLDPSSSSCPESWEWSNGRCFTRPEDEAGRPLLKSWTEGEALCDSLGGHLASFYTASENEVVGLRCGDANAACWVGMHKETSDGAWKWADGTPADYQNWRVNKDGSREPDGKASDEQRAAAAKQKLNCTEVDTPGAPQDCRLACGAVLGFEGSLVDAYCGQRLPVVCERPASDDYSGKLYRLTLPSSADFSSALDLRELELFTTPDCSGAPVPLANATLAASNQPPEDPLAGLAAFFGFPTQRPTQAPSAKLNFTNVFDNDTSTGLLLVCPSTSRLADMQGGDSCAPYLDIALHTAADVRCVRFYEGSQRTAVGSTGANGQAVALGSASTTEARRVKFSRYAGRWFAWPLESSPNTWTSSALPRVSSWQQLRRPVAALFALDIVVPSLDLLPGLAFANGTKRSMVKLVQRPLGFFELNCRVFAQADSVQGLPQDKPQSVEVLRVDNRTTAGINGDTEGDMEQSDLWLQRWSGIEVSEPGTYDICHCLTGCEDIQMWQDAGEVEVHGMVVGQVFNQTADEPFDLALEGWGLPVSPQDFTESRVMLLPFAQSCGQEDRQASDVQGLSVGCTSPDDNTIETSDLACMQQPVAWDDALQVWQNVTVSTSEPQQLRICHCYENCGTAPSWRDIGTINVGVKQPQCPADFSCQNGGTCVAMPAGDHTCKCAKGYEGYVCQDKACASGMWVGRVDVSTGIISMACADDSMGSGMGGMGDMPGMDDMTAGGDMGSPDSSTDTSSSGAMPPMPPGPPMGGMPGGMPGGMMGPGRPHGRPMPGDDHAHHYGPTRPPPSQPSSAAADASGST